MWTTRSLYKSCLLVVREVAAVCASWALVATPCCAARIEGTVSFDSVPFTGMATVARAEPGSANDQSKTFRVTNGELRVDLPVAGSPNGTTLYRVDYMGSSVRAWELWSVPNSGSSLNRRNVVIGGGASRGVGERDQTESVQIQADLAQRPFKGGGFGTDAVAMVNAISAKSKQSSETLTIAYTSTVRQARVILPVSLTARRRVV